MSDRFGEAIGLLHLGQIAVYQGDDAQAQACLDGCLPIAREISHREIEGECELLLVESAFEQGDLTRARACLERSLMVCLDAGDRRGEAQALYWLGKVDLESGDIDAARSRLSKTVLIFRDFEMREELGACLEDHAVLANLQGRPQEAIRLASSAQAYRERLDLVRSPRRLRRWQARLETLRTAVPEAAFTAAWDEGRKTDLEETIRAAKMQ